MSAIHRVINGGFVDILWRESFLVLSILGQVACHILWTDYIDRNVVYLPSIIFFFPAKIQLLLRSISLRNVRPQVLVYQSAQSESRRPLETNLIDTRDGYEITSPSGILLLFLLVLELNCADA